MKLNRFALFTLLGFASGVSAFAGATFTPTGVIEMIPTSMSDDASIVVGTGIFGAPNLYYTEAGGAIVIGDGCPSGLPAVSGDGATIVGCHENADGKWNAALWLGGTGWQDLGTVAGGVPCDSFLSGPWDLNHDGSLAVGLVYLPAICKANAGTWDLAGSGEATALPSLFGSSTASRANAVNADGSVIVGWQDQLSGERSAAKWVNGTEELILTDDGQFNGEALAVSNDGKAIVGTGYAFGHQAWIWREGDGITAIGRNGGEQTALGLSDDGRLVVGFARWGKNEEAWIWGKGNGISSLSSFITQRGAVVPDGWQLTVASIISPDGRTIYGWGYNPDHLVEMFKVQFTGSPAGSAK